MRVYSFRYGGHVYAWYYSDEARLVNAVWQSSRDAELGFTLEAVCRLLARLQAF